MVAKCTSAQLSSICPTCPMRLFSHYPNTALRHTKWLQSPCTCRFNRRGVNFKVKEKAKLRVKVSPGIN